MLHPLPKGRLLNRRFRVRELLGHGDFGATYLADDLERRDLCVVRELAPREAERNADGGIDWRVLSEPATWRLRQAFVDASRAVGRSGARGTVPVRAAFTENATAYVVMEYLPGARSVREILIDRGPLPSEEVQDICGQLLETLQSLHRAGILHGDIRPSNILVTPRGQPYLTDFGAARVWCADCLDRHADVLSVAYSPPELQSTDGRRGPASDLYSLAASLYHALAGVPPTSGASRAAGEALVPVRVVSPGTSAGLAHALEAALNLAYPSRPQSADEMAACLREGFSGEDATHELEGFDEQAAKLMQFRFDRFECPQCGGVLEQPRPLRRLECPVCRDGFIRRRNVDPRSCAVCRGGPLKLVDNSERLRVCPLCTVGILEARRKGFLRKEVLLHCPDCEAQFDAEEAGLRLVARGKVKSAPDVGEFRTRAEWRELSGRAAKVDLCEACGAQFDPVEGGRFRLMVPERILHETELLPEEWGRIAAGLSPTAGNAECDACFADFVLEDHHLTLVYAPMDPYEFAERYRERRLKTDDVRWVGVGKTSRHPGLVCSDCGLEVDPDGRELRLAQATHPRLLPLIGQTQTLQDWHRSAQGLPRVSQEAEFESAFDQALESAYRAGRVWFRNEEGLLWAGRAVRWHLREGKWVAGRSCTLQIREAELIFATLFRRKRLGLDMVARVHAFNDGLSLEFHGERPPMRLQLMPTDLVASLASGPRRVRLTPTLVAERLAALVGSEASVLTV